MLYSIDLCDLVRGVVNTIKPLLTFDIVIMESKGIKPASSFKTYKNSYMKELKFRL